jgi:hypothetical protein
LQISALDLLLVAHAASATLLPADRPSALALPAIDSWWQLSVTLARLSALLSLVDFFKLRCNIGKEFGRLKAITEAFTTLLIQ